MTKLWIILFFCASAVKSQIHSKTWCLKIIYSGDCSSLLSSSGEPKPSSHTSTEKKNKVKLVTLQKQIKTQLPPQLWKPFRCLILLQHPVNTHLSDTSSTTTLSTTTHGHKKKSNIFTVFFNNNQVRNFTDLIHKDGNERLKFLQYLQLWCCIYYTGHDVTLTSLITPSVPRPQSFKPPHPTITTSPLVLQLYLLYIVSQHILYNTWKMDTYFFSPVRL